MKIIHTADWHIGQTFYGYNRKAEHICFFDWLRQKIAETECDLLIVAGDIFDSPNPSAESQKMYYRFLRETVSENPHLQIIITAGNHDSAARLEAPNPLLEEMNIVVRGVVPRDANGDIIYDDLLIPTEGRDGVKTWVVAVPYLRQGDYPQADNYAEGVSKMYNLLYRKVCEKKKADHLIFFVGHMYVAEAELLENDNCERAVVGGLESISASLFNKQEVAYTALGHIHKAQRVGGYDHIRYSGSPLPMSFSEKNYNQGINLITITDKTNISIDRIAFEPLISLISLPKEPQPLNDVLREIAQLPDGEIKDNSPYLELKVLITEPEPTMRHQIEEVLKGKSVRLTSAVPYIRKKENRTTPVTYENLKSISPSEMAEEVFQQRFGEPMPAKLQRLLQEVINDIE